MLEYEDAVSMLFYLIGAKAKFIKVRLFPIKADMVHLIY